MQPSIRWEVHVKMQFKASQRIAQVGQKYLAIQQKQIRSLEKQGMKVINLGRGNPDQTTFPQIVAKAKSELEQPQNYGYPPYGGNENLKAAIRKFYAAEYQVTLAADEVTVFSGSTAALTALPMALANSGDVILTPDPAFFGYHIGITMSGATEWRMPLLAENNYLPDLSLIPPEIAQKAKLMFLNYSHNPTGAGATSEFFERVAAFGLQHKIAIVHDFAYADLSFAKPAPSFLQSRRAKETGIEIYTLSKTFNMAGWRCAFAVGNASIIKLLKTYIQNSVGGTFNVVQNAGSFALLSQKKQRQKLRALYSKRRSVMRVLEENGFAVAHSAGTFFSWVRLPATIKDERQFAAELLKQKQVAVVPGSAFGKNGQGYFRISLVTSTAVLLTGCKRIVEFVKDYHEGSGQFD